jgi:UDP-glucuronate decarboxylase
VTGPINLGNPGEFSIKELAEKVVALVDNGSRLVYEPLPQDDPTQRQPDITKAREILGWQPRVSLEEGLPRTVEYFRAL